MTVTVAQKKRIIARDLGLCMIGLLGCTREAQTADHRANRGAGGSGGVLDHPANLIGACSLCNAAKEDATGITRLELIDRGVIVPRDSTHRKTLIRVISTPVVDPAGRGFLLIDHDTRELIAA